jgi:hypothetical protein
MRQQCEIADLAPFLASERASFIEAAAIPIATTSGPALPPFSARVL